MNPEYIGSADCWDTGVDCLRRRGLRDGRNDVPEAGGADQGA